MTTTVSPFLRVPFAASFSSAASATPVWGQLNMPVASARAAASASSRLGGLLDHPVEFLQRPDRLVDADRVADLDGRGQRALGHHRLEPLEALSVGQVEGIGRLGLRHADAGQPRDDPQLLHQRQPRAQCADVAQVPARDEDPVGHVPVELLDDLDRHRLLPLQAERVHAVGQVNPLLGGEPLHQRHAVVEVAVDGEHRGAIGQRLHQLGGRDLAAREDHQRADAGGRAVGRQGGRGVTGGGAGYRLHRPAVGDHLLHRGDQHGHAEVLEGAGVGVSAQLDPEVVHPDLLAVTLRPEQVGAALEHGDDVLVVKVRLDPLLLAPDAGAVRPLGAHVPVLEQLHPLERALLLQGFDVVSHLEQVGASGAAVDDLVEGVLAGAAGDAAKGGTKRTHEAPNLAGNVVRR